MAQAPATARVLICDPDIRFGLLLKEFLQTQGWNAEWVSDGRKALARWEALLPDLVVTELQGEDLDGFEFLDAMTRIAHPPPVVVCTRLKGVQAWKAGVLRSLGVRRVLARPVRFPALSQVLEEVIHELTGTLEAVPAVANVSYNAEA